MAKKKSKLKSTLRVAKPHVKTGDAVYVIAGKEKGKMGKVLKVVPSKGVAFVEKLNVVKRHVKSTQANPSGGIVEKEAGIRLSNLLHYDEDEAMPTRIGRRTLSSGEKVRYSKRSGEEIKG